MAVGLLAIVGLEVVDYLTGPYMAFSLLFLLPVIWLAWNAGAAVGVVAAVVAVLCETIADLAWPEVTGPFVYVWNVVSRTGVLVFAACAVARIKRDAHALATLNARLDAALARERDAHQETSRRFGLLVDVLTDFAIVQLGPDGRAERWSAATAQVTGMDEAAIEGRTLDELFPAADARADPLVPCGERRELERWTLRADGERYYANMVVYALGEPGEGRALAVVRDATLRATADEAIRRARDEAVAAIRELETFSYTVGHDLRAPLRAVDGLGAILEEDAAGRVQEQELAYVRRMRAAARQMGRLVDDLLAVSQLGRAPVRRAEVDLAPIAHRIVADLRAATPGRTVDVHIADRLVADADPALLTVALRHLLDNAWKFTAERPDARIEVGEMDIGERAFFVRDNGVGFDPRYVDRLFRPFERLHGRAYEGTGIGLAKVRRIVERHGGRVWAEGAVGGGATVYFTLPEEVGS